MNGSALPHHPAASTALATNGHHQTPFIPNGDDLDKTGGPPLSSTTPRLDVPYSRDPSYLHSYHPSTIAIHADDPLNLISDVAPPLHVSTTYRYPRDPTLLRPIHLRDTTNSQPLFDPGEHCYSRQDTSTSTRFEQILTHLLHNPAIVYSSGLASFHALLTHLNPRAVAIGAGYHGCHGVLDIHVRLTGAKLLPLDCDPAQLGPGDLIHLETPINPTGLAFDIAHYAAIAHSRGAYLSVDSTFGPPPLQDPFVQGADVVMHSGTKYIGGHSDMLCGVLAVRDKGWVEPLMRDRLHLGSVMGGLEGWLGVRSVRTLELRVLRQSENAGLVVAVLDYLVRTVGAGHLGEEKASANGIDTDAPIHGSSLSLKQAISQLSLPYSGAYAVYHTVAKIEHASLQTNVPWLKTQMPSGFGSVFGITMKNANFAQRLPSKLALFHHATSLGGVESLIEWRTMTDDTVQPDFLRVSVGIEDWRDLVKDLIRGMGELVREQETGEGKVGKTI